MNVLSLCDYSGRWAQPYADAGHHVFLVDPKHAPARGDSVYRMRKPLVWTVSDTARGFLNLIKQGFVSTDFDVILAAPPCTDFASSGARWWADKDNDGRTDASVQIVHDILDIIDLVEPTVWALENPVGRIASLVPALDKWKLIFNPCDYAGFADDPDSEAYTKKTCIWGRFNADLPTSPVEPVMYERGGKRGSWMWANLGGNSARTKELRSNTPTGFSRAFFRANS